MRELVVTYYENEKSQKGTRKTCTWEELKNSLAHVQRGLPTDSNNKKLLELHKRGPAIILGDIPDPCGRKDLNVANIHLLSLDLDDISDKMLLKVLTKIKFLEYYLYTTHKHLAQILQKTPKTGKNRIRVLFPLKTPLTQKTFKKAWQKLNEFVFEQNDPSTKNIGRLNYLPSTYDLNVAYTYANEGEWLDTNQLPVETTTTVPQGVDIVQIEGLLAKAQRYLPKDSTLRQWLVAIKKGEDFAAPGHRNEVILQTTKHLAQKDRTLSYETLEYLYGPSLDVMPDPPEMDKIWNAYEKMVEKLQTAGAGDHDQEPDQHILQFQAKKHNTKQYTAVELEKIADAQKCSVEELARRWILQSGGGAWFLGKEGKYSNYIPQGDCNLAALRFLAPAPIELYVTQKSSGKLVPKTYGQLAMDHASVVSKVMADMTLQQSVFDPDTSTFHESILGIRSDLVPTYYENVDKWIKLLCGDSYKKALDWLSQVSDLNKILCGIYFSGAPGTGKTLLATGVNRIWTEGSPASAKCLVSAFNDDFARSPLILADEALPTAQAQDITRELRELLSVGNRTLKRKYQPTANLKGAIRLVLTANTDSAIQSTEALNKSDCLATSERFLFIEAPEAARVFLESLDKSERESFGSHMIAEHALWLRDNHQPTEEGDRFYVEGNSDQTYKIIVLSAQKNAAVVGWLVKWLESSMQIVTLSNCLPLLKEGKLYVNVSGVVDHWTEFVKSKKFPPSEQEVASCLDSISAGPAQIHFGNGIKYYEIEEKFLISWCDRAGSGNIEGLKNILKTGKRGNSNGKM